ncbi:MAG: hypothetical protein C0404_05225 [Verrucomicrobia bacterium]|nr:hypothetical protein [Verrucomicrobiota bacterium]
MTLFVISVLLALSITCICSILEAVLLSLSVADVAEISQKHRKIADTWQGLKKDIQKPIAVILIVNTLAHTIGATVSGGQFNALFGSKWIAVYSLVFSFVMIQWAEILPKSLAVRYNKVFALWTAGAMKWSVVAFKPIVVFLEWLNKPFSGKKTGDTSGEALSEITVLAKFASLQNMITREQEDIVSRSIKLSQAKVQDIMVDRSDIKYLSTSMSMAEALIEAHIHHHTRYVLVEGQDADKVVGYVNVKDIVSALKTNPSNPSLRGIARPLLEVRLSQYVPTMLKGLVKGYQHMAVVKDDSGKVVGLVTMEDVIEAIVGDIEDEYDVLPAHVHKLSDIRFLVGGGITLQTLKEQTGFDVPQEPTCLHDWLCGLHGKIPPVETTIAYKNLVFIVRKLRRSKIHEVIVDKR